jgi:hypothetical protein
MTHGFRLVEMNVEPLLKHDMFLCRFAPKPPLLVRGNLRWVTLKQTMHLQLVIEILSSLSTSGDALSHWILSKLPLYF